MVVCDNPYVANGCVLPCGKCVPCCYKKRRIWAHRMMLEGKSHAENAFVTLTYSDKHIVYVSEENLMKPTLVRVHLQLFLKRLRKRLAPQRIRFYGAGEYGDKTDRPHYHLALFGMPTCKRGATEVRTQYRDEKGNIGPCCSVCTLLCNLWERGNVYVGQFEPRTASYVAKYLSKRQTWEENDPRCRPFSRMSLKPGIGYQFLDEVASRLMEDDIGELADVPIGLRHGKIIWPLGTYLRRKLRERIGRDAKIPEEVLQQWFNDMQPLRDYAKVHATRGQYENTIRGAIMDVTEGKRIQLRRKG